MAIDPRILAMPGRSTSGFHRPGRHWGGIRNELLRVTVSLGTSPALRQVAPPTVTNVVDFGPRIGQLRVKALASTVSKPMEGFVPRRGDGRFFGLNILGVSQTTPPKVSC